MNRFSSRGAHETRDLFLRMAFLAVVATGAFCRRRRAPSRRRDFRKRPRRQGASIPDAAVSVKNDKTGEQRSATTNAQGFLWSAG